MLVNSIAQVKDCVSIQSRYAIIKTSEARMLAKVTRKTEECLDFFGLTCSNAFAHLIVVGDELEELRSSERFAIVNHLMNVALVCQMNIDGLNRRIDIIAAVPVHKLTLAANTTVFSVQSITDDVQVQLVDVNARFMF